MPAPITWQEALRPYPGQSCTQDQKVPLRDKIRPFLLSVSAVPLKRQAGLCPPPPLPLFPFLCFFLFLSFSLPSPSLFSQYTLHLSFVCETNLSVLPHPELSPTAKVPFPQNHCASLS